MNEEKIKALLSDEKFVAGILELETPEDVCKAFADEGVTVTTEEIIQVKEQLASIGENNDELSEDQLEDVSGGYFVTTLILWGVTALIGIGIGDKVTRRRW